LIDRDGAGLPVTDQDSVVDWPAAMDVGAAVNETMAGACFATVIVTVAKAEPLLRAAVSV
jgi:hypothetical protein